MNKEETLAQLVKKQDEYIKFLDKELNKNAIFLHVHGIRCSKEVAEQGIEYRKEIEELKTKLI